MPRPIHVIANDVRKNWRHIYFGAYPYLQAMMSLIDLTDRYGADDARSIILYFLSNASTWRGAVAKRIKQELKEIIK